MSTPSNTVPRLALAGGASIPQLGLGMWRVAAGHTLGFELNPDELRAIGALNREGRTGARPADGRQDSDA